MKKQTDGQSCWQQDIIDKLIAENDTLFGIIARNQHMIDEFQTKIKNIDSNASTSE